MSFFYNIAIHLYHVLIRGSSLFNNKARQWINGRKNIFRRLSNDFRNVEDVVWFHAASLGEFEQGRPVMEAFRKKYPRYKILLTFFSPSGYEIRKNYQGADFVYYLPLDTRSNAKSFIQITNPRLAIFIKYEFWFNYLDELSQREVPTFVISAIFREDQHFFKSYGGWFRKMLKSISTFFVQNVESEKLLNKIGIDQVVLSGDTRFDRVFEISQQVKSYPLIERFSYESRVVLGGSTWPQDEELLKKLLLQSKGQMKLIIAPHEIHAERIKSILLVFSEFKVLKYSEANESNVVDANVLIIDGMGFLSGLYQYCEIAYIGGGFGKGIHNILEAATFGKPILFGPKYHKFKEANDLIARKGVFSINNGKELIFQVEQLASGKNFLQSASTACRNYVRENKGATEIILSHIDNSVQL